MDDLRGRVALVTGATGGLGRRLALELARQGARLVVTARDLAALQGVAAEAGRAGVEALAVPADLTDPDDRRGLVDEAVGRFGQIDVLVNNAGIIRAVAFGDENPERLVATNLVGPLALTRLVLPGMLERREGHVLTIASITGLIGVPHLASYSASNAALVAFSRAMRIELRGTGVSATVVCPGFMCDAGAYVPYATSTPWYLGCTSTERVARHAMKAVREDRGELIVNSRPLRPFAMLQAASPRIALAVLERLGLPDFTAGLAAKHLPYPSAGNERRPG
jgi:short-subunit dehydrogenase